jgi:hypothetical protein
MRSRIVLLATDGTATHETSRRLHCTIVSAQVIMSVNPFDREHRSEGSLSGILCGG